MDPDNTYLETYNCDPAPLPKPLFATRARKQIFRSDYVLYHYVHYSSVTKGHMKGYKQWTEEEARRQALLANSTMAVDAPTPVPEEKNDDDGEAKKKRRKPKPPRFTRYFAEKEPSERYTNETTEALMIHAKSSNLVDTAGYPYHCPSSQRTIKQKVNCFVGFPWPMKPMKGDNDDHTIVDNTYPYYNGGYNETLLLLLEKEKRHTRMRTYPINSNTESNVDGTLSTEEGNDDNVVSMYDDLGFKRNCYINPNVEYYWVPRLRKVLESKKRKKKD